MTSVGSSRAYAIDDPVQPDWNATVGYAYIKNKPSYLSNFANDLPLTDWNSTGGASYILHKPTSLSQFANDLDPVNWQATVGPTAILNKPNDLGDFTNNKGYLLTQTQTDWNATSGIASILNKPALATVATTGTYSSLVDSPSVISFFTNDKGYVTATTQAQSNWTATTGSAFIQNKPTALSAFANDSGYITAAQQAITDWNATNGYALLANKPTKLSQFVNDLIGVAGSFNVPGNLTVGGQSVMTTGSNTQVNSDWVATTGVSQILNKPTAVSAFTNDASYLTANTQVQPDWNASSGKAVILNKPGKLGAFTNDLGYALISQIPTNISALNNDVPYATVSQIPTKVSTLSNDSLFITASQLRSADWNSTSSPTSITNKPTNLSQFTNDLSSVPGDFTVNGQFYLQALNFIGPSGMTASNTAGCSVTASTTASTSPAPWYAFSTVNDTGRYWQPASGDGTQTTYTTFTYTSSGSSTTITGPYIQLNCPAGSTWSPAKYSMGAATSANTYSVWTLLAMPSNSTTWQQIDYQSATVNARDKTSVSSIFSYNNVGNPNPYQTMSAFRWVFNVGTQPKVCNIKLLSSNIPFGGSYTQLLNLPVEGPWEGVTYFGDSNNDAGCFRDDIQAVNDNNRDFNGLDQTCGVQVRIGTNGNIVHLRGNARTNNAQPDVNGAPVICQVPALKYNPKYAHYFPIMANGQWAQVVITQTGFIRIRYITTSQTVTKGGVWQISFGEITYHLD